MGYMFVLNVIELWHQLSVHIVIPCMGYVLDCMVHILDAMGSMLANEMRIVSTVKV